MAELDIYEASEYKKNLNPCHMIILATLLVKSKATTAQQGVWQNTG